METVGVTASSSIPTDPVALNQAILVELRVISLLLQQGLGITDEPFRLRDSVTKTAEIVIS